MSPYHKRKRALFDSCDLKRRPMKYGVSSFPKKTSNGSGSRLTSRRNRFLPFMSEIVQPPALKNCGNAFRKFIGTTQPSILMVWQPIKPCYQQRGIKSAPRVRAYEHHRTIQLHAPTAGISLGPILIELFKDGQESYRSNQILHLLV